MQSDIVETSVKLVLQPQDVNQIPIAHFQRISRFCLNGTRPE